MLVRRADPAALLRPPGTDFKHAPACRQRGSVPVPAKPTPVPPGARGVALITVMLVLAILTAIAGRVSFSNQVWLRQVSNGADFLQSALATRAVQDWVGIILAKDDNEYDSFQDVWARPLPPLPVGRGFVRGYMEDMQARINLNTLLDGKGVADREAVRRFKRLLRILDLNPGIADAVVDWMDADDVASGPWGAEDGYYLGMNPPYVTANRRFRDSAELRLVRGIDRDVWYRIRPYIGALPERDTAVNINTASPEVLAAAVNAWGPPRQASVEAALWSGKTRREPFKSVREFYEAAGLEYDSEEPPPGLDIRSKFFLAHTQVEAGAALRRMATLYQRDAQRANVLGHWRVYD